MNSVAWNPKNERMFASCSDDWTVRIWESPVFPVEGHNNALGGRLGGASASGVGRNGFTGMSNGKGKGKSVVRQRPWEGSAGVGLAAAAVTGDGASGSSGSNIGGEGDGVSGMGDESMGGEEGSSVASR